MPATWTADPRLEGVDLGLDPLEGDSFHQLMAELRERGPVVPVTAWGEPYWLITRFHVLKDFCRRDDEFPGGAAYAMNTEPAIGQTFMSMEGREHDVYRQLAMPMFRSRPVSRFTDTQLRGLVDEIVDRFADRDEVDLVTVFTGVLPFYSISRKLGLPFGSEDIQREWSRGMLSFPWDPDGAKTAAASFTEFLVPILEERRREPQDDVLSHLLSSEYDGRRMTDEQVVSHVRLIYAAGATTTQDGLGNLLSTLLRRPDVLARIESDRSLIPAAVHELLRFEPPVSMNPRYATFEGVIGDVEIPAGSNLLQGIAAANRDTAVFSHPDVYDPDREEAEILTFGFGRKFCPGYHLARAQISTALDVLLERLPGLRLIDDTGIEPRGGILRAPAQINVTWDHDRARRALDR